MRIDAQGLRHAAAIDCTVKGPAKGDVWDALLHLTLRCARVRWWVNGVKSPHGTTNFSKHVPALRRGLRAKLETLMKSLKEHSGASTQFDDPKGGIFLWIKRADGVDTAKRYPHALAAGVAINPRPA